MTEDAKEEFLNLMRKENDENDASLRYGERVRLPDGSEGEYSGSGDSFGTVKVRILMSKSPELVEGSVRQMPTTMVEKMPK